MAVREKAIKYWWVFAILAGILAFVIFMSSCKPTDNPFASERVHEVDSAFVAHGIDKKYWTPKYEFTTPKGVEIDSAAEIPAEAQAIVDEALTLLWERYSKAYPKWNKFRNHSDFHIYFINPMCTNQETEPGSPCIYTKGYQTAGTVIGLSDRYESLDERPIMVLPHQADSGWQYKDYLKWSVFNEGEHYIEWGNRLNEPTGIFYNFIGGNDAHPHLPDTAVGLVSRQMPTCKIFQE